MGRGRLRSGAFHDHEGFTTPGVLKFFTIMENRGFSTHITAKQNNQVAAKRL